MGRLFIKGIMNEGDQKQLTSSFGTNQFLGPSIEHRSSLWFSALDLKEGMLENHGYQLWLTIELLFSNRFSNFCKNFRFRLFANPLTFSRRNVSGRHLLILLTTWAGFKRLQVVNLTGCKKKQPEWVINPPCSRGTASATRARLSFAPLRCPMLLKGWHGNPEPKTWISFSTPGMGKEPKGWNLEPAAFKNS